MRWRSALALAIAPLLGCTRAEATAASRKCDVLCGHVVDAATSKPIEKFTLVLFTNDPRAGRPMYALPHGMPYPPGRPLKSLPISSSSGEFDLGALGASSVFLGISAPGHLVYQSREIQLPSPEPLEVRLDRAWQVTGKVVDANGAGVSGAAIYPDALFYSVDQAIANVRERPPLAQTDAGGRFTFGDVQSYQPDVGVLVLRFGFVPRRAVIAISGPMTSFDIHLQPAVAVSGILTDSAGRPAANAWIEAKPSRGEARHIRSGNDGRFSFDALPREKMHFAASRQFSEAAERGELGYASHTEIDLAAAREVMLTLPASGFVHGTMTGLARLGAGYQLQLRCGDWSSALEGGTDGEFRATVPAGKCYVSGSYSDSRSHFETDPQHVVIADGSDVGVELPFANPTELRITVNDVPMEAALSITRAGESQPVVLLGADRGVYRFAGLRSGSYDATFEIFQGSYRIPLEIGSRGQFAFALRTEETRLSLVDDEGKPLSGKVTIVQARYAQPEVQPLDPAKFATFLPFGEYEVHIESRGYEAQTVTLRVPSERQVVTMHALSLPFAHPAIVGPIDDDEREVLAAVVRHYVKEADDFQRETKEKRGSLILMNQTAQPRVAVGFVYDEGDLPTKQRLASFKASPSYAVLEERRTNVRSLDPLARASVRLQPFEHLPLRSPQYREDRDTEIEVVDGEAFYRRFPDAAGLLMLSRPGIAGDEAIVSASLMMVLSLDERLIRLKRVDGRWSIADSIILYSMPGC